MTCHSSAMTLERTYRRVIVAAQTFRRCCQELAPRLSKARSRDGVTKQKIRSFERARSAIRPMPGRAHRQGESMPTSTAPNSLHCRARYSGSPLLTRDVTEHLAATHHDDMTVLPDHQCRYRQRRRRGREAPSLKSLQFWRYRSCCWQHVK